MGVHTALDDALMNDIVWQYDFRGECLGGINGAFCVGVHGGTGGYSKMDVAGGVHLARVRHGVTQIGVSHKVAQYMGNGGMNDINVMLAPLWSACIGTKQRGPCMRRAANIRVEHEVDIMGLHDVPQPMGKMEKGAYAILLDIRAERACVRDDGGIVDGVSKVG